MEKNWTHHFKQPDIRLLALLYFPIGGSKGAPATAQKFLNSFSEILAKSYVGALAEGLAPTPAEILDANTKGVIWHNKTA